VSSDSLTGRSFGDLDISSVLRSAGEEAAPLLARHRFDVVVPDGLATQGDADLVSRIVANLLNNAATHTPPGTSVVLEAHFEDGQGATFSFRLPNLGASSSLPIPGSRDEIGSG